jgi:hypothetical protein
MGGLFSRNKELNERSSLLVKSTHFSGGDDIQELPHVDADGYQAISDDDIENQLSPAKRKQPSAQDPASFEAILQIIAKLQKKSYTADHKDLDLFKHPKDLINLFTLNKFSLELLHNNPGLIQHFIDRMDQHTQFQQEMYEALRQRSRGIADKLFAPSPSWRQAPLFLAMSLLLVLAATGTTFASATLSYANANPEGTKLEDNFWTPYGSDADEKIKIHEIVIAISSFVFLASLSIHVYHFCTRDQRSAALRARFNTDKDDKIKQLESKIHQKISELTEEQANNPTYRTWLTLFVNTEKVGLPVAPYQEDDPMVALSM